MTVPRMFAILFIFGMTALAWSALGGTIVSRTGEFDSRLSSEVAQLWGGRHNQVAPLVHIERPREVSENVVERDALGVATTRQVTRTVVDAIPVQLDDSDIEACLKLDHRRKGLLWYDTYGVGFQAKHRFVNPDAAPRKAVVRLKFPSAQAIYDDFVFRVNGIDAPPVANLTEGLAAEAIVPAHGTARIEIGYRSRGLGDWRYAFTEAGVAQVKSFSLEMTTDFARIDFPPGTLSPSRKTREGKGWRLNWEFASLAAGQGIGVDAPNRLNPGPFASRVTFFAPVGLLFFFTVMVILGVIRNRSLHPMNYFFLAAAFFAFHLLLAYLVDHIDVHAAFLIAAAVSILLVTSYLRIVAGLRVALVEAGLAQIVFLVLFSYAFFFEGYTGLAVTIGAILTLFVLMQVTARIDWGAVFARKAPANTAPRR